MPHVMDWIMFGKNLPMVGGWLNIIVEPRRVISLAHGHVTHYLRN